jgi:hypothetical protein
MVLAEKELLEIVEHAASRKWGANGHPTDYTKPYNVIAYCSERIAQIPFQLNMPQMDTESKEKILRKLAFLNGVVGRIATLEDHAMESSSYTSFEMDSGKNQIDIFLSGIGYKEE